MIFVLLTDERTLVVHADARTAIRSIEGIDTEDGETLFFDDAGQPLEPIFDEPNQRGWLGVTSGRYRLCPALKGSRTTLIELLPTINKVEGPPTVSTIEKVERLLQVHSKTDKLKSSKCYSP